MRARPRLDEELVAQGFFTTTDDAMRAVLAGEVYTTDRKLTQAGQRVKPGIELHVHGRRPFVSRGGTKLAGALDALDVSASDCACLDIGCSTGGFTDCLLSHGARQVVSVDVGYADFDWSLRNDPRVTLLERTNAADLAETHPDLLASFDLIVCDVSFTSVTVILPAVTRLLVPGGRFLTLVKPQFELPRDMVGEGGVVRDPAAREQAVEKVCAAAEEHGLRIAGTCPSPIAGRRGNREFFVLCVAP